MTNFKICEILMQAGDQKPEYQSEWPYIFPGLETKTININQQFHSALKCGVVESHFILLYTVL